MTREQAKREIDDIDFYLQHHTDDYSERSHDAMMMAIKALSQEPTKEEQALLQKWRDNRGISIEEFEDAMNALQEPCDDVVSRQAVFDLVRSLTRWCVRSEDGKFNNVGLLYDDVMFGIDKLPSVTHKSGKWIKVKSGDKDFPESIVCSRCNNENSHLDFNENAEPIGKVFVTSKYCPKCGAKMESEDKE